MALLDNEVITNKLSNFILKYHTENLHCKLYLLKSYRCLKEYKKNKKVHNLLLLLLLPNKITVLIHQFVNYIKLSEIILLDESKIFKFPEIEHYHNNVGLFKINEEKSLYYTCRCGSEYFDRTREVQMRRIDEGATVNMFCSKCKKKMIPKY